VGGKELQKEREKLEHEAKGRNGLLWKRTKHKPRGCSKNRRIRRKKIK
jgi:hypothetical protein